MARPALKRAEQMFASGFTYESKDAKLILAGLLAVVEAIDQLNKSVDGARVALIDVALIIDSKYPGQ